MLTSMSHTHLEPLLTPPFSSARIMVEAHQSAAPGFGALVFSWVSF